MRIWVSSNSNRTFCTDKEWRKACHFEESRYFGHRPNLSARSTLMNSVDPLHIECSCRPYWPVFNFARIIPAWYRGLELWEL